MLPRMVVCACSSSIGVRSGSAMVKSDLDDHWRTIEIISGWREGRGAPLSADARPVSFLHARGAVPISVHAPRCSGTEPCCRGQLRPVEIREDQPGSISTGHQWAREGEYPNYMSEGRTSLCKRTNIEDPSLLCKSDKLRRERDSAGDREDLTVGTTSVRDNRHYALHRAPLDVPVDAWEVLCFHEMEGKLKEIEMRYLQWEGP